MSGHNHDNVLGPFSGSGMAIGGAIGFKRAFRSFYGFFGLFMALFNHDGHSGSRKGSQHIAPDVPGRDPTLIHADPPVWSRQACLWPVLPIAAFFGQFLAIKWVKMAGSKAA